MACYAPLVDIRSIEILGAISVNGMNWLTVTQKDAPEGMTHNKPQLGAIAHIPVPQRHLHIRGSLAVKSP